MTDCKPSCTFFWMAGTYALLSHRKLGSMPEVRFDGCGTAIRFAVFFSSFGTPKIDRRVRDAPIGIERNYKADLFLRVAIGRHLAARGHPIIGADERCQARSSADLRGVGWRYSHHPLIEGSLEEHGATVAGMVDVVKHEAEIARLVDGLRRRRLRFDQLEPRRKLARAQTRLMETWPLRTRRLNMSRCLPSVSSGPALSVSSKCAAMT